MNLDLILRVFFLSKWHVVFLEPSFIVLLIKCTNMFQTSVTEYFDVVGILLKCNPKFLRF